MTKEYNPFNQPIAEQWLASDEYERIELVRQYHVNIDDEDLPEDKIEVHSLMHVIVENQLAEKVEHVPQTMAKLLRQGLDRHDAVHAIAAILCEDIFDLMQGNIKEFSMKKYRKKLDKITAKRWRKGQY